MDGFSLRVLTFSAACSNVIWTQTTGTAGDDNTLLAHIPISLSKIRHTAAAPIRCCCLLSFFAPLAKAGDARDTTDYAVGTCRVALTLIVEEGEGIGQRQLPLRVCRGAATSRRRSELRKTTLQSRPHEEGGEEGTKGGGQEQDDLLLKLTKRTMIVASEQCMLILS